MFASRISQRKRKEVEYGAIKIRREGHTCYRDAIDLRNSSSRRRELFLLRNRRPQRFLSPPWRSVQPVRVYQAPDQRLLHTGVGEVHFRWKLTARVANARGHVAWVWSHPFDHRPA